jgi:hypothetical protein
VSDRRTTPVRFTKPCGLVRADNPTRFVDAIAEPGAMGELLVQGTPPFSVPEGWLLVHVGFDDDNIELWAPVHPVHIEALEVTR